MSKLHPALVAKGVAPGTVKALLAVAQFYVGTKEKPKGSNHTIFGAWYGVQTAWCAIFVSYCLNHSGNGKTINGAQSKRGYALCSKGISWFKKKKAWFPVKLAQPGDVAFFDWNHDHDPDHTGIVVKVDLKRKRVLTIEGNTGPKNLSNGGMVAKQWRSMSVIIGVGRPAYDAVAVAPVVTPVVVPVEPPKPVVAPFKTIKVGSKGAGVKAVQKAVGAVADGVFGPKTEAAVKVWQKKVGLPITGIIDSDAWSKIVGK
jgi:peptidoglycan hydrolase-like protein with peptidoglycan-binding domain